MDAEVSILNFLHKDQENHKPKDKEKPKKKVNSSFLGLTDKQWRGYNYIYKPILDVNNHPFRRVNNPIEFHIQSHDDNGNSRWFHFNFLEGVGNYHGLTQDEIDVYNKALALVYQIKDMNAGPWIKSSKEKTLFYAYSMALLTEENGKMVNKLENPTLQLVYHNSANFLKAFYKSSNMKSEIRGSESWILDYYSLDRPDCVFAVKTVRADIGFDVAFEFVDGRKSDVTPDQLKSLKDESSEVHVGDLETVLYSSKFDRGYFELIIRVCNNWLAEQANQHTDKPIDSNLDSVQTEIESGGEINSSSVPPLGSTNGDIPLPDASIQMKG